jgi:hypothetical protein
MNTPFFIQSGLYKNKKIKAKDKGQKREQGRIRRRSAWRMFALLKFQITNPNVPNKTIKDFLL